MDHETGTGIIQNLWGGYSGKKKLTDPKNIETGNYCSFYPYDSK